MTRPGIEPRSPGPLANTLTAGPMSRLNECESIRMSVFGWLGFMAYQPL